MKLRVGQIKVVPVKWDMTANAQTLKAILDQLAAHQPDVVVTPECFLDGYCANEESVSKEGMCDYSIDPDQDELVRHIRSWASANQCWVIFGCSRRGEDGNYNSALIIDREGNLAGVYDKTHLQAHDKKYQPGAGLNVYESDFGKFGVMICADRRWPETVRTMAVKGARIIFNPTYGMSCDLNLAVMRARSFENECFIAFTHPSQSLVTGPDGSVVSNNTDDQATYAVTEIDLSDVDAARELVLSHLKDRRTDLY